MNFTAVSTFIIMMLLTKTFIYENNNN